MILAATTGGNGNMTAEGIANRRAWIDYARGIAIIMVVFGHVAAGFKNVIYNGQPLTVDYTIFDLTMVVYYARMPLFFFISGLYIRKSALKRGLGGFIEYKFSTIFYPYLIWGSIQILFQWIGFKYGFSNTSRSGWDFLYLFYRPDQADQFWFLYALFVASMAFAVFGYVIKTNKYLLLAIASIMYIGFYYLPAATFLFGIKYLFKYFFYLVLGDVISSWVLDVKNFNKLSSWALTAVLIGLFFLLRFLMKYYNIPELEQEFFSLQNVLLLCSIFTGLAFIINISFVLTKYSALSWISYLGKYSLYIYTMHIIVNGIVRFAILKITDYKYPDISLYIVTALALLIPVLLYKMIKKTGLWFLYSPKKAVII